MINLPPEGELATQKIGDVRTEAGATIHNVSIAYRRWGEFTGDPHGRNNLILVEHALTGDSNAAGWWEDLIGPGAPLDTDRFCVMCTNVLGGCSGSTGPSSEHPDGGAWGSRFPAISIRDQVRAEAQFLETLGINSMHALVGGSMGGARALEWTLMYPDWANYACVIAMSARASAWQIGIQTAQITSIVRDPDWQGGDYHGTGRSPIAGLGIARRIAHLTYRFEGELDERFANTPQAQENPLLGGRYAIQSYLEHQADKLIERFDPGSYVVLSDVLNHHDVGRNRGGIAAALASCTVPTIVAGIDSDRLYPLRLQAEIAEGLGNCVGGLQVVRSDKGHDGFLTEFDAIADLLKRTVDLARR